MGEESGNLVLMEGCLKEPIGETLSNSKCIMREVKINELSRGYIVTVGCQSFAFSTKDEMLQKLIEYINNPDGTERKWYKDELFA